MASTPFTAADPESAAMDALSERMGQMLRRMEEALARMSSAPATVTSATAAPTPSSTSSLGATPSSSTASALSTPTLVQLTTNGASATPCTTAGVTTASVVGTNTRSSTTPPTALSPTTTSTSAIAVSRTAIPFAGAQKVFDEMPCKSAASNLHVMVADRTADKNDYLRGLLCVRDHHIDKASVKRFKHIKKKVARSSPPTTAPTASAAAPTIRLAAPPTAPMSPHVQASPSAKDGIPSSAPASTPALVAPCAEDEILSNSPTGCSTQRHNHDVAPALCSAVFPLGVHKTCRPVSKPIRYIASCYPHSIGAVLVVVATDNHEDCMLLEIMTEPNSAMPWPPASQDSLLSERKQGCFSFWTPICCGWALVQQRPPWPPPVRLEELVSVVFCCSQSDCKTRYLHCELNNHCWTHCIELLENALQSPCMISIELLNGGIREILMLSCTASECRLCLGATLFEAETSKLCYKWLMAGPSQCIYGKLQCDYYKISKHRAYTLCIHGKIPWSPSGLTWSSGQHIFNRSFILQHTLEGILVIDPHFSLHQFNKSLVSQRGLEELLLHSVHCSFLKLMANLTVKNLSWRTDMMTACLWRADPTCYSDSIVQFPLSNYLDYLEFLTVDDTKFTLKLLLTHCQIKEQQLDYKALTFSEGKWSSPTHIRKPGKNQWVTEAACCQELGCTEPNGELFGSKNLVFMEMQQIDKIQSWKEELLLGVITGNHRISAHAIWKSS